MSRIKLLLSAAAFTALMCGPSHAGPFDLFKFIWPHWLPLPHMPAGHPHDPHYHGAPGPEAGIGLPVLATVGGYVWYVRRRRRKRQEPRSDE